VTTLMAVKTSDSRPSGQRRHQQYRVRNAHIFRIELTENECLEQKALGDNQFK
jgi:hypothetical protein